MAVIPFLFVLVQLSWFVFVSLFVIVIVIRRIWCNELNCKCVSVHLATTRQWLGLEELC